MLNMIKNLTVEDVKKIEKRMRELIEQDIPFERVVCSRQKRSNC